MKTLVIEDNKAIADAMEEILEKGGNRVVVVRTVREGLTEYRHQRFDAVVLDTAVDKGRGMEFVDEFTPKQDSTSKSRSRLLGNAGIVVIRRNGDNIPSDNPLVKKEIPFPFTSTQLTHAILDMLSERDAARARKVLDPPSNEADPVKELESMAISPGGAYLFYQEKPGAIRRAVGAFFRAGYDIYIITAARPKVAKERMGLDRSTDTFILSGAKFHLGTMVQSANDFIERSEKPVIAIDDLDAVINHCGLDRTLRALSTVMKGRKQKGFTFMTSVNGRELSGSVKDMLAELMTVYETEV